MRIVMWGLNHRTAGVELRERLAFASPRLEQTLAGLRRAWPSAEAVLLSTCNRTEFYLARPAHDPPDIEALLAFVAAQCQVAPEELRAASIQRENEQALMHLFRVACGLESMVVGEPQILGQIKRAYEAAAGAQVVGPVLHRSFQQALAIAKDVRNQTGIDQGRMSVGSVAVDFAKEVFDHFSDKTVVGIGAGDMAKLTLQHLKALQPARLWITNRTPERAVALAQRLGLNQVQPALSVSGTMMGEGPGHEDRSGSRESAAGAAPSSPAAGSGGVRAWEDLDELLVEADVVLTSTAAREPIITVARFKPLTRRRRLRPLFIIDIALPRNVEPAVGTLPNVYLYNLDDLQRVVEANYSARQAQAALCEPLLAQAVHHCMAEIQNRDIGQLIKALRQHLHDLGQVERSRTLRKLQAMPREMAHDQRCAALEELLDEHTTRLINKILHLPLSQLDRRKTDTPLAFYATALRRLFGLKQDAEPPSHQEHQE